MTCNYVIGIKWNDGEGETKLERLESHDKVNIRVSPCHPFVPCRKATSKALKMSNQTNEVEVRNNDMKIFKFLRSYCHCLRPHIELDKKYINLRFHHFVKRPNKRLQCAIRSEAIRIGHSRIVFSLRSW